MQKVKHCFYTLLHPFNGFDAVKWEKKGSIPLALVGLFLYYVSEIYKYQGTGFIFNINNQDNLNIFLIAVSSFVPFVLFAISNWAVCTLFDGEGKFSEILIVVGYALIPMTLISFFTTFISNYVLTSEEAFVSMVSVVGVLWSVAVGLVGLTTVHQYSFKQTIFAILASILGVLIIMFIAVLLGTLFNQVYSFFYGLYTEIIFRM